MKLRLKTLLAVGTLMLVMILIIGTLASQLVVQGAIDHEARDVEKDLDSVEVTIDAIKMSMSRSVADWAAWDSTYAFMEAGDQSFIESSLGPEICDTLKLNYFLMFNSSRDLVYGIGYDYENEEPWAVPDRLVRTILTNVSDPDIDEPGDSMEGIVLVDANPLIIAVHPITDNKKVAPVNGFLVMARHFDTQALNMMSDAVQVRATIVSPDDPPTYGLNEAAWNDVVENDSVLTMPLNKSVVAGFKAVKGIDGSVAAVVAIESDRNAVAVASIYGGSIIVWVAVTSLIFCVVMLMATDRFVTRRVERLSAQVREVGKGRDIADHVEMDGSDELAELADSMNSMLGSLTRTEKALKDSEMHYRAVVNDQSELIIQVDDSGKIRLTNYSLQRLMQYREDQLLGMNLRDRVSQEHYDAFMGQCREAATYGGVVARDCLYSGNGRNVWVTWVVRCLGAEGGVRLYQAVGRDQTQQKETELALAMANKKLNLLASITRHDLMNKLAVASGYISIEKSLASSPGSADHLTKAEAALQTIERYLEFTRDYQRMGLAAPVWIGLADTVDKAAAGHRPNGIKVMVDIGGDLQILADPLTEKVFSNLLDNSERHGERVTTIRVSAKVGNDGLHITFEDNGVGVPAEDKEQIFEAGHGAHTGYGLFLAREILSTSGMTITETGEAGQGARFEIFVPPGRFSRAPDVISPSSGPTA